MFSCTTTYNQSLLILHVSIQIRFILFLTRVDCHLVSLLPTQILTSLSKSLFYSASSEIFTSFCIYNIHFLVLSWSWLCAVSWLIINSSYVIYFLNYVKVSNVVIWRLMSRSWKWTATNCTRHRHEFCLVECALNTTRMWLLAPITIIPLLNQWNILPDQLL